MRQSLVKPISQFMAAPLLLKGDYPITPAPFTAMQVRGNFWNPRLETNRLVTIPSDFQKCEETERIDNFAKAGRLVLHEAAVAHFNATGKRSLLEVALKNADPVADTWGSFGLHIPPGHQEIEIGLVKLYRVTSRRKYLDLAKFPSAVTVSFIRTRSKRIGSINSTAVRADGKRGLTHPAAQSTSRDSCR